jgi:Ras-related protein R-Ras2
MFDVNKSKMKKLLTVFKRPTTTSNKKYESRKEQVQEEEKYKIAVVGQKSSGKSAIVVQFIQNIFVEEYDPTIEEEYRRYYTVDNVQCFLEVLDTAGQEEYKALRDQYMRTGDGFILVFSVSDRSQFRDITEFYEQILIVKDKESWPMVLVGHMDCEEHERVVTMDEAMDLAKELNIPYLEASTKNRYNVDECFTEVVRAIRKFIRA